MDKSCHSTADSISTTTTTTTATSSNTSNTRDHYLKHLNKLSHKISKPAPATAVVAARTAIDAHQAPRDPNPSALDHPNNQQSNLQQPPVYNINKSDFREVVQKLTGSPAHERLASPPPIQPPKPPSSRLQRIRPPPLAQLTNRPPPLMNCAGPQNQNPNLGNQIPIPPMVAANANPGMGAVNTSFMGRQFAPLSPLPPLPAVHAAAESPVSAYMRYLQSSGTPMESKACQFTGFSPLAPLLPMAPPPASGTMMPPPPQFQLPLSPLPFGRLNSPRSPYPLLSPGGLLFSPNSGFPQFPLSPTVPVPSPKGGGM